MQASKLLCTERCPCTLEGAKDTPLKDYRLFNYGLNYAHKIQDCYYYSISRTLFGFEDLASQLEKHYQCSGVCKKIDKFLFTEEKAPVKSSCISAIT
jgi:hypothetical protein